MHMNWTFQTALANRRENLDDHVAAANGFHTDRTKDHDFSNSNWTGFDKESVGKKQGHKWIFLM